MEKENKPHVAIIGGGVAGIGAAYLLQRKYRVTLIEKNDYLGGHTHTVPLPHGPDALTPVDTGFIVMNEKNYPDLCWFFAQLGVKTQASDMSLSVEAPSRRVLYSSDFPYGLLAQARNLWTPAFYQMILEIIRFYSRASRDLQSSAGLAGITLGDYLKRGKYSQAFTEDHLAPMAAAIWSTPLSTVLDFPVMTFLQFYENHGLLSLTEKPQWRTVVGGSHAYVRAFEKVFRGQIRLETPVAGIQRDEDKVQVLTTEGPLSFDHVVLACHADEALALLKDPSEQEEKLLGAWEYSSNPTVLHTDRNMMPSTRRAWASWNVFRGDSEAAGSSVAVTYFMNRLQRLKVSSDYFVTLNREEEIDPAKVLGRYLYDHPTYDFKSLDTQASLQGLNGRGRTWYCGSYFGHGFHEDAIRSGFKVAALMGAAR
ncbi:MAG: FAD-dependent oxidoreductase [Candidatus Omnitrophota bacterium]|jgi:predicted NAD/FAD-binding protein